MPQRQRTYPPCFGKLEVVFPKGEDGLRQSPPTCFACVHKIACMRRAMAGSGGLQVREEVVDRAYSSGLISFWQRWSRKKELNRQSLLTARREKKDDQ